MTSDFVAQEVYGLILERLNYEPKLIVRHIYRAESISTLSATYVRAWRAKQKVFEMRFGTYEASYDNLPVCCLMLCREIQEAPIISSWYQDRKEHQAFFSEPSSVLVHVSGHFNIVSPVLCIDGTFLTGRYKGQILSAIWRRLQ